MQFSLQIDTININYQFFKLIIKDYKMKKVFKSIDDIEFKNTFFSVSKKSINL
jgi:hypothetical protein